MAFPRHHMPASMLLLKVHVMRKLVILYQPILQISQLLCWFLLCPPLFGCLAWLLLCRFSFILVRFLCAGFLCRFGLCAWNIPHVLLFYFYWFGLDWNIPQVLLFYFSWFGLDWNIPQVLLFCFSWFGLDWNIPQVLLFCFYWFDLCDWTLFLGLWFWFCWFCWFLGLWFHWRVLTENLWPLCFELSQFRPNRWFLRVCHNRAWRGKILLCPTHLLQLLVRQSSCWHTSWENPMQENWDCWTF